MVVVVLTGLVLAVGGFWLWSITMDEPYAGIPHWLVGLVVVGLIVALAVALSRLRDPRP
jgi:hypothetical protein